MSSLIKLNNTQTPSFSFFKQFVPYATTTDSTKLTMRDWSISAMIPPDASYFVYDGSTLFPPCTPCKWIVFKQMINMDEGDFAYLVRNVQPGSRPVQGLGSREVFFNDINNIPGGPVPNDDRIYLRLKPTGDTQIQKPRPVSIDLKNNVGLSESEKKNTMSDGIIKFFETLPAQYGWVGIIVAILSAGGIIAGLTFGYKRAYKDVPITGESVVPWAVKTRAAFWWVVISIWNFWVGIFKWFYNAAIEIAQGLYKFFVKGELAVAESEAAAAELGKAGTEAARALEEQSKLAARLAQLEGSKLTQVGTNSS
jgi:hypothetical protein